MGITSVEVSASCCDMCTEQTFKDHGLSVLVELNCTELASNLEVETTTTNLCVRNRSGTVIFEVPQLFSTIDAPKTTWNAENGHLQICLQKLDSQLKWRALASPEVSARLSFHRP